MCNTVHPETSPGAGRSGDGQEAGAGVRQIGCEMSEIEVYTGRYEREQLRKPAGPFLALYAGLRLDHRQGPFARPGRRHDLPEGA